jgi:malonate-semialdehyde dehydrogenase (acetylating)/methylmalonate-semialdehyde dehydrogenase
MTLAVVPHWIDGTDRAGTEPAAPVWNPATGAPARQVPLGGAAEVGAAVAAAARAFPAWRESSLARRTEILFRARELVSANAGRLADLVVAEHGKVRSDAEGEVRRGLDVIEHACGIATHLRGHHSANVATGVDTWSIRQPLGVVAGITPFNFPVMVPLWMAPLAIAAGNTFVLKPSEKDPSAPNLLARLFAQAGLPPGVLNVVHGGRGAVEALIAHPEVRALSFVGSTPVARAIFEAGTRAGKRVQALGGAKNHLVVLPDADLGAAAAAAVNAAYGAAGERCMAVSVVVAVGGVGDDLVARITERAAAIRVGDGADPAVAMGPLVTGEHRDRVAGYLDLSRREGAEVVLDGRGIRVPGRESGFFLGPCLLDRVTPAMAAYRDEIFGPVLSVVRAERYEDARDLINANPWANGVALFTTSGAAARRFQQEIEVGMVGINVPIPVPVAHFSFGGWRQSLFGDAHVYGEEGVRFYTRAKVVTARWSDPPAGEGMSFPATR